MSKSDVIANGARELQVAAGESILGLVRDLEGEGLIHRGNENTMIRGEFRGMEMRGFEKFRGESRGMHRGTEVRGTEKFRGEFRGMHRGAFRGAAKTV